MTTSPALDSSECAALRAVAELVGRLLLKEVDASDLERLRAPSLAEALSEFGIELPNAAEQLGWIEQRAADYHDLFLRPETGPLVQSLWTQGRYEGDATARVRQLATFAALEFQPTEARGAAPDHLGSLLLLWSATDGRVPEVAGEIVTAHLEWALVPLRRMEAQGGFYGAVALTTLRLLESLAR